GPDRVRAGAGGHRALLVVARRRRPAGGCAHDQPHQQGRVQELRGRLQRQHRVPVRPAGLGECRHTGAPAGGAVDDRVPVPADRRPERDDGADEVPVPHPERSGRPGAARDQGQRPRLSRRTGHLGGGLLHRGLDRAACARWRAVVQRAGASALIYPGGGVVPPSPRQRPQSPPLCALSPPPPDLCDHPEDNMDLLLPPATELPDWADSINYGKARVIDGLPNHEYHSIAARSLVSKGALDRFSRSPAHYLHYLTNLDPEPEKSYALILGAAFHCLLLEPEVFEREYVLLPDFGDMRSSTKRAIRDKWIAERPGVTPLRAGGR